MDPNYVKSASKLVHILPSFVQIFTKRIKFNLILFNIATELRRITSNQTASMFIQNSPDSTPISQNFS